MLKELHIKNFAIIEDEQISFTPGLNVITGETGSGKSMLLQTLELILGGRPKGQYIRNGAESWEIEALFDLSALDQKTRDLLPDIAKDSDELLLMRSMNSAGRSKIYVNGRMANVALLEEIASSLVNICGQGQHIRLLEPKYHLELLDGFAGNEARLEKYKEAYSEWRRLSEELDAAASRQQTAILRRAELEAVMEDLKNLDLYPGVREELENSVKRMSNVEGIVDTARQISDLLNGDNAIYEQCSYLSKLTAELSKLDESAARFDEELEQALDGLREFEVDIDKYASSIDVDQDELNAKRDTLAEIARLERKYRTDDAGLLELRDRVQNELLEINDPESFDRLKEKTEEARNKALRLAKDLSKQRKRASDSLCKQVVLELKELNMPESRLESNFEEVELGASGVDRLELLISTNKGMPCRPLKNVASGGELSRIMLVLKKILRDKSGVNVLVFDEVDTGISGSVARAVGEKLKALSEHSQVLCITHLAQVASLGDHHLLLVKEMGENTKTTIRPISGEARVDEIARMLAGHKITKASRESAKELLG